jgi:hypothetical protein
MRSALCAMRQKLVDDFLNEKWKVVLINVNIRCWNAMMLEVGRNGIVVRTCHSEGIFLVASTVLTTKKMLSA